MKEGEYERKDNSPLQQWHEGKGEDMYSKSVDGKVTLHTVLINPPLVHHAARVVDQHVQLLMLGCETLGP